jgi:hypothetical protein
VSDFRDALRYAMGVDLASQGPKTLTEISHKYIQPIFDAEARGEGLTAAKLRAAKRAMDKAGSPPVIFRPTEIWYDELATIDPKALNSLIYKGDSKVTTKKAPKQEKFNTIGVRFPQTPGKEYTYKVRVGAKPYLGQELVADTPRGQAVVFVTRIDKTPQAAELGVRLKYIERKAVAL